jgi:hypothetical protein
MSNDKLTFLLTNDNRPLRELTPEGSILEEQYNYALRQIDEYFSELELENISVPDKEQHTHQDKRSETIHSDTDYNNNIFAFIGDRGSGKTSCMISVADFLINKNQKIDWKKYPNVGKVHFDTIDLIDPTYFDSTHNLISLFLAKLHKSFRQRTEENEKQARTSYDKRELSEKARNKFLSQFQKTQEHLYHLLGYIKYCDGTDLLEYVDALSASVNLKEDINELVDIYMEYMEQKDTILILRIDDIDINEKHAGEMVETMRKYFIQPNILVLISFKLQQLENIKYLELKRFYGMDYEFTPDDIREMVDKYMVKLIPRSHRIFMPQHEDYYSKRLEVKHIDQEDGRNGNPTQLWEFASVRQAVPQLIFWKTRYLFYNSYAHESFIVPSNLRELRQLIKLLVLLPDYRIYGEDAEGKETILFTNWSNKDLFKNYFFETWLNNHLPADMRDDAQRILGEARDGNLNAMVYDLLDERYEFSSGGIKKTKLTTSFGDVLSVIHKLEQRLSSIADLKFLFFIKSFYSMKLYEAYDLMTEDENHRIQRNHGEIFIDDDTKFALNTPYQQLSGVTLFNSEDYIPSMGYSVDNEKLNALIASCIKQYKALPKAKTARKKKLHELELRVKWAELLMLCTNSLDKDIFDPGTMFTRLPYLYSTDKRQYVFFENSDIFFKDIINKKDREFTTLSDDFRNATIQHHLKKDARAFTIQRWQSFCTIRNVEVLEGFLSTVKSGSYTFFDRYENLRIFFTKACEFDVKTYDRDESGREPYSIHFKFFEKVLDLLSETDKSANAALKAEITSILGDVSENTSEIENNGDPSAADTTTPAV